MMSTLPTKLEKVIISFILDMLSLWPTKVYYSSICSSW